MLTGNSYILMKLSDLKDNQTATVINVLDTASGKTRLSYLGLIKGVKITLIRRAPFGDPIEIKLRDFCLAIRKDLADKIMVEQD